MRLDGKVAVITGAARGIGFGIARRFVAAGGRVVIADLDAVTAEASARTLGASDVAIGLAMDVTSESAVPGGIEAALSTSSDVSIRWSRMRPSRSCIR